MDRPEALIETYRSPVATHLTLAGDVNVAQVRWVYEAALEALERGKPVTVDCSTLRSLDASVVQVFAALGWGLMRAGARLDLTGVSPAVADVLYRSGVEGWLAWQLREPRPGGGAYHEHGVRPPRPPPGAGDDHRLPKDRSARRVGARRARAGSPVAGSRRRDGTRNRQNLRYVPGDCPPGQAMCGPEPRAVRQRADFRLPATRADLGLRFGQIVCPADCGVRHVDPNDPRADG